MVIEKWQDRPRIYYLQNRELIRYFFKQFFQFLVGDIFLVGLVIDGEQVHGCMGDFKVRDYP